MAPCSHFSRIDTLELKENIVRALGRHKAEKYFYSLGRLLSLRLKRSEFVKLSCAIVGKENLPLHNQLIKSIYTNACFSNKPSSKQATTGQSQNTKTLSENLGNLPPMIPQKGHSVSSRAGKIPDKIIQEFDNSFNIQSAPEIISNGSTGPATFISSEDGEVEQIQSSPGIQSGSLALLGLEFDNIQHKSQCKVSSQNEMGICQRNNEVPASCEENTLEKQSLPVPKNLVQNSRPITAPLGLGFDNLPYKEQYNASCRNGVVICQENNELPDSRDLAEYLEAKVQKQGLIAHGNSIDLLNRGLDVYLKRLLEPCMSLTKTRSNHVASLTDFQVAAESNRLLLHRGSPVLSQKIDACFLR